MVWPSSCWARAITMRPIVSVGPPAVAGTTAVTGREGNDCADAAAMPARTPTAAISRFHMRGPSGLEARIEIVAQRVAEQVEGEHREADRGAREQDHPRRLAIEVRRI